MSEPIRLEVRLGDRAYPILIGDGLLERAGEIVGSVASPEVVALVADASVLALHGDRVRSSLPARVEEFAIEPGERSKSVETAASIWRWLAGVGTHRNDVLLALGGGVTGDLAGFAAATYHRGMPWVQLPTTLLGQVDASIGGKTAIDLPEGKNLVGAFHQPSAVIADTTCLQTLSPRAFATGMAEVVKHGFISPTGLLDRLRVDAAAIVARDTNLMPGLVAEAAAVKIRVVEEDETERGARMFLNYGHTLAHALETVEGYEGLSHGEAVGIGMTFAAHLAARLGYGDRVAEHREALEAFGLPTGGARHDFDSVASAWVKDKKFEGGMRFVILQDLGKPAVIRDVPDDALRAAYEAVR